MVRKSVLKSVSHILLITMLTALCGTATEAGMTIGLDIANNDDDNGGNREGQLIWMGTSNNHNDTSAYGDCYLSP